jgi:MFS family permease
MSMNDTKGRPFVDAGRLPGGRSLYVLVGVQSAVEFAVWVTVLVVAFERGGASATGLAVAAQLVPAALLAPIVTAAGDRFPRHLVLSAGFAVLAASAAALTIALAVELPLAIVYVAAAGFTVALSATPGSVASLLVHHARSPQQLIHWNVGMTVWSAAGSLVGPLLTGLVLATTAPWVATAAVTATCAATAATVARRLPRDDRPPSNLRLRHVVVDSIEGLRYATTTPATAAILGFMGLVGVMIGAYDVLLVAVAFDRWGEGGSGTAILTATFSVGALTVSAITRRRFTWTLTKTTVVGAVLLTLPIVFLGQASQLVLVVGLIAVLGAGHALVEIGARTLLQRAGAETFTSRVFGVLDSTILATSSIGATVGGMVLADADLSAVLVPFGLVSGIVLAVAASTLRRLERRTGGVDPALLAAVAGVSFLAPLPLPTLERLAGGLGRRTATADTTIIRQGDAGTEFFIVLAGTVAVIVDGEPVAHLTAPASFGEIALLHDEPRAATVTAVTECRLGVVGRAAFLDAVRRSVSSHRSALAVASTHRRPSSDGQAP